MNVFEVVGNRNREVRCGLLAFAGGIAVFVLTVDLIFAVWLGSSTFFSWSNLEFIAWLAGIIVAVSTVQFLRFARDGRRVSGSLGGRPLAEYAGSSKSRKEFATRLENILDELCIAAQCPRPALHVQAGARYLNGFACGLRPEHWCITVTQGAAEDLSRDELQALVAHELAHLTTGDTRNAILTCAYIAGLGVLTLMGLLFAAGGGKAGKDGAPIAIIGLVIALMGGMGMLVASILEAYLSRRQEYRADAEAVRLTRHGDGMVSLLTRLAEAIVKHRLREREFSWDSLCATPLYFDGCAKPFWFDSHPPLVERIRVFDPAAADRVAQMLAALD